jgi:subtilisin family serine protease
VIAGGTDLVGDAFNGTNTPVPDNDPLDQCVGHGTHVAVSHGYFYYALISHVFAFQGIIAAQPGNEFNITGVAYKSSIYSYRIFGCTGGTSDDMVIEGLLRAYNDGMDVVTLSLGGPSGWTECVNSAQHMWSSCS